MTTAGGPSSQSNWLSGGGDAGALIRSMDWSKTSLGPPETWPQSLRTSVSLCLSSTFPILICWGPDDVQIYNDSYRPICGDLHPGSMGMPFKVCWEAALPVVGDKFDRAHLGEGTYINNQRMFLERYGYLEEAWMTFSFGAIRDESGQVGGIFHPITETTHAMLSARRTQTLRDFSARLAQAKTIDDVSALAGDPKESFELDLPFFCLYKTDESGETASLMGFSGVEEGSPLAPRSFALGAGGLWPVPSKTETFAEVTDLQTRLGSFTAGPYPEAPNSALALPIKPAGSETPFGYLVAGVSSRRALDDEYRNFFVLLASTFTTAVSNVLAYEEEQKRVRALAEIDAAKTAFFSNVSHEFRTPLTLILGPLEDSLSDDANPLNATQRERQVITHRNATRLLKLVNSLLDFSRIEAGRLDASFEPTDLAQLTRDVASAFRSTTERAGLKLNVDCETLREPFFVDHDLWEKIVLNLISNAFKFTLEGGIDVRVSSTKTGARIEVQDSGTGIPAKELPKLFERFHRVKGAKGRSFEGTGIGLALVKELVQLHGGSISAASVENRGTTFTIEIPSGFAHLPAEQVTLEPRADRSRTNLFTKAFTDESERWLPPTTSRTEKSADSDRSQLPTLLIADDNADMLSYVANLLGSSHTVVTATDGLDALAKAIAVKPDLILTDVMMPKLDGFGLLKAIRENASVSETPVILLSARAGEEARIEGLNAGADDYLVKPFSAKELSSRIAATLKNNRLRNERTKLAEFAKDEADRANQSKSAFLANMSHEIRTPMTAVLGFTEILKDENFSDEIKRDALERIDRSGRALLQIIDDILDISKVEAGKFEVSRTTFSAVDVVSEVIALLQPTAAAKGVSLEFVVQPNMPFHATSDAARVRQIALNLVGNAVKFTSKGSVVVSLGVENESLKLSVTDTGPGISDEHLQKLFKPFGQADVSITRKYGGTGLGLALSQRLARNLGGDIVLEWSEVGKGSRFVMTVLGSPFKSAPEPAPITATKVVHRADELAGARVLVAEDTPDNQMLIRRYLESVGAAVDIARDGNEAISRANDKSYDIILMDVQMPELDGLSATRRLRQSGYTRPIYALTAHAMPEEIERSIEAGCDGHLSKPITKSDLVSAVGRTLKTL